MLLRLEPEGDPIVVAAVERVDDRIAEVWYEVLARGGERLVLRLERESLRFELHTVETEHPERWVNWSEAALARDSERSQSGASDEVEPPGM
ncbi:MAG: hypothetical protein AB7N76_06405 [Planctomycetota bacterium]